MDSISRNWQAPGFLDLNWQALSWSPWVAFDADIPTFKQIPPEPGLYRIRPQGEDFLMYIGQTGRTLRQRVNELRHNVKKEEMPFNDPHTTAPSLWAWHDAEGFHYECSAAPVVSSKQDRMACECYLLWQYRLEYGSSTLCNFGRFHPDYTKSRGRSSDIRGGRLPAGRGEAGRGENPEKNPAGGPSCPPLQQLGTPGDPDWMGMRWSERLPLVSSALADVPDSSGLYLLFDPESVENGNKRNNRNTGDGGDNGDKGNIGENGEILYIGESSKCKTRLKVHARAHSEQSGIFFLYHMLKGEVLPHNRKELENDLIGCYYREQGRVPEMQFGVIVGSTFRSSNDVSG